MVEAATEYRKSGFGDEDAANLALVATMYQNVADESISAADSAGFIIAQMKAFNIEAEDATHIIDAVNAVSNNYAVSSSDLANNLGKVSSALAVGGNSFEEVLGMMTAITEITRNSSTAARGLVSVQSRFNQIIDETSSTGQKLTAFYDKHGIAIKDQNGQLRNLYDVLKDTAKIWDTLDENEQKYFLNIQAGANQTRNLAALMENFGVAIDATATAMNSAGSAAEENGRVMESLQKKIDNLKAAWENFSTNTITKDFIGNIIDAGTQLLTFANTDLGQATVKALLFGTTVGSATGFIGTFVGKIFELATEMKKLGGVIGAPTTLLGKFLAVGTKGKWTLIALGIAGITAAVIALVNVLGDGESAFDKYVSKAEEAAQKQKEYQQSLDDAKEKLEELNDIPVKDRSSEQQHEIEVLKDKIEYYERLIELEKEEQGKAADKAYKEATKSGVTIGAQIIDFSTPKRYEDLTQEQITAANDLVTKSFRDTQDAAEQFANALGLLWVDVNGNEISLETMISQISDYGYDIMALTDSLSGSAQKFNELWASISRSEVTTQESLNQAQAWIDANKNIADAIQARIDADREVSDEDKKWLDSYNRLADALKNGQEALNQYTASATIAKDTLAEFEAAPNSVVGIKEVAKALVESSDLGIDSAGKLKNALQNLADGGVIDLSNIGNLDAFILKLIEANDIKFDDKNINVETNAEEANAELDSLDTEDEQKQITVTTAEEGQALASALQEISSWIDQVNGKTVKVTLQADVTAAKDQINSVVQEVNNIIAGVNVEITTNATEVTGQLQSVQSTAQALSNVKPQITVKANTSSALANLRTISNYTIPDKYFSVVCSGASVAIQNLAAIKRGLDQLHDKTITVTVNRAGNYQGNFATGSDWVQGGDYLINDGAPVNGSRAELVVSDGVGRIYNDGDTTIQDLPQGTKIYTAAETQDILKDRGLTVDDVAENPIPAMANGTKNNPKYPDRRNDPTYSGVTELTGSGDELKENFSEWLKEKKHWLNMDIISEAQYYRDLEIMNERYLKNLSEAKDEYWQHEEEIYKYQNQSLEDQIKLEEKLSDLAKAKENRVYALSGGRFQYLQNLDAIAKAQREVDQLTGKYANGTTNARGGLSLVGENGPEMRVLGHGDGIIPAEATKNLMALSSLNIKDALSNIGRAIVTNYSFDISRLELPSVSNAGEFLDGLKNLAYQYSYARA